MSRNLEDLAAESEKNEEAEGKKREQRFDLKNPASLEEKLRKYTLKHSTPLQTTTNNMQVPGINADSKAM